MKKEPTNTNEAAPTKAINPFDKFKQHGVRKAYIKSLDYEITYRKMLQHEDDEYNLRLLEGVSKENQNLNIKAGSDIKYEKIAKLMIDPKVTVKELRAMDADVGKVIIEILAAIEKSDLVDDEGNSES